MHDVNIQKIIFSKIKFHFLIMKNTKNSSKKFSAYIFETKKHVSEMKLEGSIKLNSVAFHLNLLFLSAVDWRNA